MSFQREHERKALKQLDPDFRRSAGRFQQMRHRVIWGDTYREIAYHWAEAVNGEWYDTNAE